MAEREPVQIALTLTVAGQNDDNDAVCELNISGDEMILQPVGDNNALNMILQQAQEQQNSLSFKCKLLVCAFAAVCLVCTVIDVALTVCISLKNPNILVAEYHYSSWNFEGPLLVAQALLALTLSTFVTQVIIRQIRISSRAYFMCLGGLALIISIITGWIFREDSHAHDLKNTFAAAQNLKHKIRLLSQGELKVPNWLDVLQIDYKCCGVDSAADWKIIWESPDVPDSCCIRRFTGCGKNVFAQQINSSTNIRLMGCLKSSESFTPDYLLLLEQAKFVEAFLMIFIALVWLCCWDKFISRPEHELVVRCRRPPCHQCAPALPAGPTCYETNDENEPTNIPHRQPVVSVESHHNQRGGGDLGTKSDYMLKPKTQDTYQSGDYTEIDPTKAHHVGLCQEPNCTS